MNINNCFITSPPPHKILGMTSLFKQDKEDRSVILKEYLNTHSSAEIIQILKQNEEHKNEFLKLCDEEVCKLLFIGIL